MAYDKNTDYQKLISQAVAAGDYTSAAKYEQQRNEKIADLNAAGGGTNQYGATATNNYSNYLPGNMPSGYAGSSTGVGTFTNDQEAIKAQMNQNSKDWYLVGTQAEKDALHAQNQYLASLLGGSVTYDGVSGSWSGDAAQPQKVPVSMPSFDYDYGSRPTYESNYQSRIDEMLNQILSREDFSYSAVDDPLYQQYATQYNREGNRAMNDTLASAAANAGGMNSYAITAAQQANNYYASQLGDKIPELYQLAYEMYLQDKRSDVEDLGLLQQMDDTQYGRYRDTMSDWENDRDFAYNMYRDDMGDYKWGTEFNYGMDRDLVSDSQWKQSFDFNVGQAEIDNKYRQNQADIDNAFRQEQADIANDQWQDEFDLSSEQFDKEYGLAVEELEKQYADNGSSGGGGGSGGGSGSGSGGGYNNGGLTKAQVAELQRHYGVDDDGLWGSKSKEAAGGLSADEAWAKYQGGSPEPNDGGGGDEYEITNNHSGDDWIHVLGFGRLTFTELYNYVESGKIKENINKSKGTVTYSKA